MTIRRTLVAVCAITGIWSLVLLVTGGFVFQVAGLRLSSQMARGPLAIALLSGLTVWAMSLTARRDAAARPAAGGMRRASLLSVLVLGLSVLFLAQPAPPANQNNCLFVHELGAGMRHLLNCDAVEYLALANAPSIVLTPEHPYRQSRPLSFLAPSLVSRPLRLSSWLVQHGPYPPYGPEFVAFALINLVVLVASMLCFVRVLRMARTGVPQGMEVLLSLVVLSANDVTKLFFWSPHAQIYNLFVPCVTVYMNLRLLDSGRPLTVKQASLLGLALGIGLLMYGSFSVAVACVCAIQVFKYRKVVPAVVIGLMAVATYAAWVVYVIATTGSFYSYETEMFRQFVWLLDCYRSGRAKCVPRLHNEGGMFFNVLAQMTLVPLALIVVVRIARFVWPVPGDPAPVNRHVAIAVGACLGVAAVMLLLMGGAFVMPRLYWILIPPLMMLLAIDLQQLRAGLSVRGQRVLSGLVFAGTLVYLVVLTVRQGPYQ
jgi:hypothetical protein